MRSNSFFCFDFDGTVSSAEALPQLAQAGGIGEEMKTLTDVTMKGLIPFQQSFRLRIKLLSTIPLQTAQGVMAQLPIAPSIMRFINGNSERCAVVTGNLDVYMKPIKEKLQCRFFTSTAAIEHGRIVGVDSILDKGHVMRMLREKEGRSRLVAIGDGANDIPMFEEADAAISYFGATPAKELLYPYCHYVVFEENALCRLLKTL